MRNSLPRSLVVDETHATADRLADVAEARPATDFVDFEFQLPGCPIERKEFLALVRAVLAGTTPELPAVPVCWECKTSELPCRVIVFKEVCCGAMTRGGCGARCPGHGVACAGCRGPVEEPHYDANATMFADRGLSWHDIAARMRIFSAPVWMTLGLEQEAGDGHDG
jgi:sulfhydrogenase subunit delta